MFNMVYIFNFCSYEDLKCGEDKVAIYEALEVLGEITDNCDTISKIVDPEITHIVENNANSGLKI